MLFQTEINQWYQQNKRDLPWRYTRNPYVIWLSEIILQQTRVEQGLPYFNKFLEAYPSLNDFANADEQAILKLWQGLGYYSRARNMLQTALFIQHHFDGQFPTAYEQLIKLKGIGKYTAAAISSISVDEKRAVVDGNVYRVLARYFGINTPINSNQGQKEFEKLANQLIENQIPSVYNQAIMEFGALQCRPQKPNCSLCPLHNSCFAFKQHKIDELPVKLKKTKVKHRWFNYFVALDGQFILTKKRGIGDIWQHLYDFPLIETTQDYLQDEPLFKEKLNTLFAGNYQLRNIGKLKHTLTHQIIHIIFFGIDNYIINFSRSSDVKSVTIEEFKKLPHPKIIGDFIKKHF